MHSKGSALVRQGGGELKATDILFQKVMAVLNSDMTSYQIIKGIGDTSNTHVYNLRDGRAKVSDIKLEKLVRFEEFYDKEIGGVEE